MDSDSDYDDVENEVQGTEGGNDSDLSNESADTVIAADDTPAQEMEINEEQLDRELEDNLIGVVITENNFSTPSTFDKSTTISEVIERANVSNGEILREDLELLHNGRILPRTVTLRDAGILHGTNLNLTERESNITVQDYDGRNQNCRIRRSEKVKKLKEKLLDCQQRLMYHGRELLDDRTLNSYNIREGCPIQMIGTLRGG